MRRSEETRADLRGDAMARLVDLCLLPCPPALQEREDLRPDASGHDASHHHPPLRPALPRATLQNHCPLHVPSLGRSIEWTPRVFLQKQFADLSHRSPYTSALKPELESPARAHTIVSRAVRLPRPPRKLGSARPQDGRLGEPDGSRPGSSHHYAQDATRASRQQPKQTFLIVHLPR
ncbi:hypothetical protein OH76DRAFT_213052 [Lentinus brumalis]|uniref:Uncharacterized protein n=1 Tax=Lentinus brumalis TaxID=2498619 RepID=A0A371CMT6_9APHY|nr:hypothetical protein OH76DRAFT_213052 [Polyporus brumalis]